MASGSQNMTTFYAKRIIGDAAASSESNALLQTGTDVVADAWILNRTNRLEDTVSKVYGIKYKYDSNEHDKVEFYGGYQVSSVNTPTAWVQLDTGDVYILGNTGIGAVPDGTHQLYVVGSSKLNGNVGIGADASSTYKLYVNGKEGISDNLTLTNTDDPDKSSINFSRAGYNYINVPTGGALAFSINGHNGNAIQAVIEVGVLSCYENARSSLGTSGTRWNWLYSNYINSSDYIYTSTYLQAVNHLYLNTGHVIMRYNNTWYNILYNHANGNISLRAASGGLYIGYENTTLINWMNGRMRLQDGCLSIFPNNSNYREGIRIHSVSNWSDITLCGNDNTGDTGISANSWFIGNNNGNFYISRNGSPGSTAYLSCVSNAWNFKGALTILDGADLNIKAASSSNDTGDIVWWYGNGKEQARFWMGSGWTTKGAPSFREYKNDGTSLYSGVIPLGDGTGASGTWGISVTGSAGSATYASSYLASRGTVSGTNHAEALKAYFDSNKASEPRNCLVAHYSSAMNNGSLCMGYFLSGYDSGPYGGFFVCQYNTPRYVGISGGTYTQHDIITNQNYTSWTVTKTGGGASGSWGISVTGSSGSCTGNALTCSYPYGFSSKTDNATWGNTTGTSIVAWNDSTGGSIAFRRDNPSSGKLSVKVDGRFYGNEGNNPAMLMSYENDYWGMRTPDAANAWIRTSSSGIIPYQSGSAEGGHSGLGTSSWYFSYLYVDRIYSGKITMNQPAAHRDNGIVGTYDYTKVAAIWSMGASYQIKADGTGLGTLYGAAYGYAGQASMGGSTCAGGHQFLWCENGVIKVALGQNVWTAGNVTASNLISTRLQYAGNIYINANTDNSGDEFVLLTATRGVSSTLSEGFWVKKSTFGFINNVYYDGGTLNIGTAGSWKASIYANGAALFSNRVRITYTEDVSLTGKNGMFVIGNLDGSNIGMDDNEIMCRNGTAANSLYLQNDGGSVRCGGRVYATGFNDYAEYRQSAVSDPGRVVVPGPNGIAILATQRLMAGARVISDTHGFAIGDSDVAKTPLAMSGRVLAHPYRAISEYHLGDAVCSAPNGTVDVMTREEIKEYPERVIGTVNEIPMYSVWVVTRTMPEKPHKPPLIQRTPVRGRIWIDVK